MFLTFTTIQNVTHRINVNLTERLIIADGSFLYEHVKISTKDEYLEIVPVNDDEIQSTINVPTYLLKVSRKEYNDLLAKISLIK